MSTSFAFIGFSLLVVLVYNARQSFEWRQAVLVAANLFFLASFSTSYFSLLPMAGFLIFAYAGLQWIRTSPRIAFLPVMVLTLTAFICMKRYAFVPAKLTLPSIFVTVGISYILFRVLHLFIDTHSGALKDPIGAVSFFNYTANFATLSSGPIQLYPDFVKMQQRAAGHRLSVGNAAPALERIVKGVFKTNILALLLSTFHTRMLDSIGASQSPTANLIAAALAMVYYPLFLFCNFSGYIDIVIGVDELLGFKLPENFDRPFSSDNFLDFWTFRWHITLSSWLKKYVYNPLLINLMRTFPSRKLEPVINVFAFFVTFFLVGVWHGQTPEFLFYGFLLGLGVSVNKTYQLAMTASMGRKKFAAFSSQRLYVAFARGLTFTYFAATLVLFWSSWRQIGEMRAALGGRTIAAVLVAIFAGSTLILAVVNAVRERMAARESGDPILALGWRLSWNTALIVILIVITIFMNQAAPDIVYKAF